MVLNLQLLAIFFLLSLSNGQALRKGKFLSPPTPSAYCLVGNVTCSELPLQNRYCLSSLLTYTRTSTIFADDSKNLTDVFENLKLWSALKSAPECWNVIQPFLCSVYLPKCENGLVERSSSELCEATRKPCQIVAQYSGWPDFLQCEALHFQPGCYPLAARQKFNRTSSCVNPLVATENPSSVYDGLKGCGIQCHNPLYTEEEHERVHTFIAVLGTICLFCTLFAILTFLIDWKAAGKYPTLILFFVNICFFLGTIGWLLQFSGLRDSIVCRSDGTFRMDEPKMNEGETAWCTLVFLIIYFFMMAGVVWFVVLAFSWYLNFQSLGTPSDKIEGKTTYFHVLAWTLPLILTIVALAIGKIEGDSLSGICFVGYVNHGIRAGLVLAPVGIALIFGLYFLIKGLITLTQIKRHCPDYVSDRATEKLHYTIVRIGVFTILACVFVFASFVTHIYIFIHQFEWKLSLRNYIICLAKQKATADELIQCKIESRPHLGAVMLNIFTFFGAGIAMSSWVWTGATLRSWLRFIGGRMNLKRKDHVVRMKKHKMIARVFAQRREPDIESERGLSIASTHEDPVGMDIDLYSASSRPASSAMMRALPRLTRRRNGVLHPGQRRYSDSDIQSMTSYMSRRMSGESIRLPDSTHRNSFYSRHHCEEGLDIRRWAKHASKWTRRTKVTPIAAPISAFHKQQIRLHKRHEAALERAARNSEVSSISDGVSEISSAVFDRNLPLPPIGDAGESQRRRPDYSIFTASCFAPGELRRISDPLAACNLPDVVDDAGVIGLEDRVDDEGEKPAFKRPVLIPGDAVQVVDIDDDDISVLEM